MNDFLTELADLMDKHGVSEFEVVENVIAYHGTDVDGIEITIDAAWDEDGECVRERQTVQLYKCFNANDVRKVIE